MAGFFVVMLAGFASSFHCVGMCGGFACALGGTREGSRLATAARHLLYNLGRLVSYMFIGALAGLSGSALIGHGAGHGVGLSQGVLLLGVEAHRSGFVLAGEMGTGQRLLAVAGGGLMIVMALQLMGLMRHLPASLAAMGGGFFVPAFRALLTSRSPAAPVALGVMNGFLPCPLVVAFAALAAASGTVVTGILTMAALGLGTFPAMLFMASVGGLLTPAVRRRGVRLAGSFVLAIGVLTIARGVVPSLLHVVGNGT